MQLLTTLGRLASFVAGIGTLVSTATISSQAATSVAQYGITWTFDKDYQVGQFVNGDWWVVGPVVVTSITPADPDLSDARDMHGSVINLKPGGYYDPQGFDHMVKPTFVNYSRELNVARRLPLSIAPGATLISTISHEQLESRLNVIFKEVALLTVLGQAPEPGSFRPPYAGADRECRWNVNQMDFRQLRSLRPPISTNVPRLEELEAAIERPLLEQLSSWTNSHMKAADEPNYPRRVYGREIAHVSSLAGLYLQTDVGDERKRRLLIRMCQWGIDVYGLAKAGMNWYHDGGHQFGRKLPMFIAGRVLNDPEILRWCDAGQHLIFQEDQQHFFVEQTDIDTPRYYPDFPPYTQEMLGMPEWGGKVLEQRDRNSPAWTEAGYRAVNGGANTGTALVVRLMGGEAQWNRPAFFEYTTKRFWPRENANSSMEVNSIHPFVRDMWRADLGPEPVKNLRVVK
jgi:hypothetical protein